MNVAKTTVEKDIVLYSNKYCKANVNTSEAYWHLFNLYTVPGERRSGYARELILFIIEEARLANKNIRLTVSPYSDRPMNELQLQRFYESLGFVNRGCYMDKVFKD